MCKQRFKCIHSWSVSQLTNEWSEQCCGVPCTEHMGHGVMSEQGGGEGVSIMQYQIFVNNKLSFPSPHLTIINNEWPVTRTRVRCGPRWPGPHIAELSKDFVSLANLNFAAILRCNYPPASTPALLSSRCSHSNPPNCNLPFSVPENNPLIFMWALTPWREG